MAGEPPTRDGIADPWGQRTPYPAGTEWPARRDQYLQPGVHEADVARWVPTASILHSNGDAMDVAVADDHIVGVRGRPHDRVNRGRLGPKDLFGWQANHSPDRLRHPRVRRGGRLVETDWDTAMRAVCDRSSELLNEQGPSAIGFYTSGQLFCEEYYTLAAIGHGAIGTNHMDGNTRLCTATAAEALKQSFGCDGQPGSYADIDHADALALYGHNMAETQPVLWSRVLDRRCGADPPALLCVDPRHTAVAAEADLHLAPLPGTNLALLNALLHELIATDAVDHDFVACRTVGYEELAAAVGAYPPEWAAEICGIPATRIRHAAQLLASANRLTSTVLQGVYQSHQATASAVAVNNVHLLRGMLGAPGAGILQMNGQPTAENTRECGADGDLTGFRNWANEHHVADLARLWDLPTSQIPHYSPPTHAMQMLRYAEQGTLRFLWISATNPAVSLPDLARIRDILTQNRLFVVAQDIFPTETTELADVVLPAATWGEKVGTLTNADRTVHLSEKAVEPPGQARADLTIFLDYARRMDFRDRDGQPFPAWHDAESAFDAWKEASAGRPCDYTALSYGKLREAGGIPWPCDAAHPNGTERLYADGAFFAHPDYCEDYGKDLLTGAPIDPDTYRAMNPDGKAMLKPAEYVPPHQSPGPAEPFVLITGRTLYHFHTRTKTGRAPQLQRAAPEVWVEIAARDAREASIGDGDLVELVSGRGTVRARVRVTGVRPGVLFLPFHYGYWDAGYRDANYWLAGGGSAGRAANELTHTEWDPCSKQPLFKTSTAAIRVIQRAAEDRVPGDWAPRDRAPGATDADEPGAAATTVTEVVSNPAEAKESGSEAAPGDP